MFRLYRHRLLWRDPTRCLYGMIRMMLLSGVLLACRHTIAIQPPVSVPEPGAVRLNNGMIFRGMCSLSSRFVSDEAAEQRLELRMIDQGYRQIYVSTRVSEPAVVNPNDWPTIEFSIPQKRTGRKSVPDVIGVPEISPFDENGVATIRLRLPGSKTEEITVGITRVNELCAEVSGLSHRWTYFISLKSIPPGILFPGILQKVPKFDSDPFVRLELSRMLIRAGLLLQAESMLQSVATDFPEASQQLPALNNDFRSELGRQILLDLELRRDAGQYQLALNAGRIFPQTQLSPEIQLRTKQLVESVEEKLKRISMLNIRLQSLTGGFEDPEQKRMASEMVSLITSSLDSDSVDRLAAFELLAGDDNFAAEKQLAIAASGWLMGADEAIQNLKETYGLFEARQLLLDYLRTTDDEDQVRTELLRRISALEGLSTTRLANLILHLPAVEPGLLVRGRTARDGEFQINGTDQTMGCLGRVPPEYRESRRYPVVIAFPREGMPAEAVLDWWSQQANRHGFVVVVPEAYNTETATYDASAEQHRRFLSLLRELKFSLNIDDDRIFSAGHGIGGEAAIDMGTSHPDLFAGIISIAGLGRKHFQWTAHNQTSMPWYIVVGERQGGWTERLTLMMMKLFRRAAQARAISDVIFIKYPARGFESFYEESPSVFEWMKLHKRNTFPEQLDVELLRSTDLRWSWLELQSLPAQSARLDQPSSWSDGPFQPAGLEARLTKNNAIRIIRAPQTAMTLKLSPGMPGIDLEKPVSIVIGSDSRSVDFAPSVADMLEEFRLSGDRTRLCFMKVHVKSR